MSGFGAFTGAFVGINGTHDQLKLQRVESNGLNFEGMFASPSQWNYISRFRPIAFFMPARNKLKQRQCFQFPHLYVNWIPTMKYLAAEKKKKKEDRPSWISHSCRHISICPVPDTDWCTYRCQYINPAVSLSCCYQFRSCENIIVTWADRIT